MRLHNIVPLFRTEWMTRVMLLWTQLAGGSTLAFLCAGSGLLALAARKRRLAATFVLALVGTGLVSTVLKILFNTGRPLDAIISAQQGSFPSGHMLSGTVFYGLLAALMLRNRKGPLLRATAVTLLLLVIVGIGLSRVYLGVHWPSDILGSLALALMLLSALLFFLHYAQPVRWVDTLALPGSSRVLVAAGIAGLVLAAMAAEMHSERTQILEIEAPSPTRRVNVDVLRHALPSDMGRWSEDFLGGRMEPVSLVIVGNEQEIERAFRLSGWERADLPTPVRVLQEGLAALANQPDPKGPATPAFLDGHPQGMTFEKPDLAMPSIRRRHHTRLWQTQYCVTPGCRPVWVATASFDVGLRLSEGLHIPTHRIDGALDVERDFIVSDLGLTGISQVAKVTVTAPHRGKNAAGDPFWTDGEAAVLMLP